MNAKERDMFQAYGRGDRYRRCVAETHKTIASLIETDANLCVAVSGGKDSSVLLHLLLQHCPKIKVWHWDWGIFMLREFEAEIQGHLQDFFQLRPPQLTIKQRLSQDEDNMVGYRALFGSVSQYLKENRIGLNFLGLRREESCRRSNRCRNLIEKAHPCNNAFPLKDWAWRDIWAYIVLHKIPYPKAYDAKAPLIGWDKVRFVSFFDPEFSHLGGPEQDKFLFWRYRER